MNGLLAIPSVLPMLPGLVVIAFCVVAAFLVLRTVWR